MEKNYKKTPWTNFLTMTDGIDNEYWNEIAAKCERIETLATDLRCELEELADMMSAQDCTLADESGDAEAYNDYDVQDMAEAAGAIETAFEYNSFTED